MTIRDAQPHEGAELEHLQRRSSGVWDAYRQQLEDHPDAIERLTEQELRSGRVRVAVEDGEIVGFAAVLVPDDHATVELDGLFVAPEAQRRGIGAALIEDAVARARQAGATALTVVAGPEAAPFYARCGFVRLHDVPTRFGPAARWRRGLR